MNKSYMLAKKLGFETKKQAIKVSAPSWGHNKQPTLF